MDATIFDYDWNPIEELEENFLQFCARKDELYKALHVD
jgi:hypothetical protein